MSSALAGLNAESSLYTMCPQSYGFTDGDFTTLNQVASHLGKYNFVLQCDEQIFYPMSYVATLAKFIAVTLTSLPTSGPQSGYSNWLKGQVPVAYSPQIEVTPCKAVSLIRKALSLTEKHDSQQLAQKFAQVVRHLECGELGPCFEA